MILRQLYRPMCLLLAVSGFSCATSGGFLRGPSKIKNQKSKIPMGWAGAIRNRAAHCPLNIAHRGARSLAPENTMAAFRKALEVGADGVEIDVHPTRDGHLVIIHDDTLDRTTNVREMFPDRKPWYLTDFTLEEIRRLDAGSWFAKSDPLGQIKAGAVSKSEIKSFAGEKVPTLDEVLRFMRESGKLLDVEIKQMPRRYPGIVEKVVRAIEAEGMTDRACISCFDHTCVPRIKRLNRKILAGPLSNDRLADPARYVRGALRADAAFVSDAFVGAKSLAFAGSQNVRGSFAAEDLNYDELRALRKAGIAVFVWTVNEEATMRGLIEADVTGIITDFPQRLKGL